MLNQKFSISLMLSAWIILSISIWALACEQELSIGEKTDQTEFTFVELSQEGEKVEDLKLPTGTEVWEGIKDGKKMLEFVFPEGIELVGRDEEGQLQTFDRTLYYCQCTGRFRPGYECDIIRSSGQTYCHSNQCSGECKLSKIDLPQNFTFGLSSPMFIDRSLGITFIREGDQANLLPASSDLLFEIPELANFRTKIRKGIAEEAETRIAMINAYGYQVGIEVPLSLVNQENSKALFGNIQTAHSFETVSCLCIGGNTGCNRKRNRTTGEVVCISNGCKSCFMQVEQ